MGDGPARRPGKLGDTYRINASSPKARARRNGSRDRAVRASNGEHRATVQSTTHQSDLAGMPWRVQKGRRRNRVWGKQDTNYGSSAPSFSGRQTWDHHVRLTSQALSSPTVPVDAVVYWFLGWQALAVEPGIISAIECLGTDGAYLRTDTLWHYIANVPVHGPSYRKVGPFQHPLLNSVVP